MLRQIRNVLGYRLARLFARGRVGFVVIALVVGSVGGIALASIATASETQSSYETLLAHSNTSQLNLTTFGPGMRKALSKIPGVRHVDGELYSMEAFPVPAKGPVVVPSGFESGRVTGLGSIGGEFFSQDRVSVIAGHLANPKRANEFVATASAERLLGWHVGEHFEMGMYDDTQLTSNSPTAIDHPAYRISETLVGTVVFNDEVVQDEVDRYPTWLLFTPAAIDRLDKGVQYINYAIQVEHGVRVPAIERAVLKKIRPGQTYTFHETSFDEQQVSLSVRPEALALGVFGLLVLLSVILIGLQLIGRQIRQSRDAQDVMRALGANRLTLIADSLCGVVLSCLTGALLAVAVAIALSPLSPIGPVRPILGGKVHVDTLIVLAGFGVLLVGTVGGAVILATRAVPGRPSARRVRIQHGSVVARFVANSGLPISATTGLHFAFQGGSGRRPVPIRSIMLGVVLAVTLIGTTLTFGAGLGTLVARPSLFGWSWSYGLTNTAGGVPPQSTNYLRHDVHVEGVSGVTFADVQIDGTTVPAIVEHNGALVSPPLIAGHAVRAKNQIVLGAETMAELHKRVGQTVVLSYGTKADAPAYVPPITLTIVGVATFPAVGRSQVLHTSMGTGAAISSQFITKGLQKVLRENLVVSDFDELLIRMHHGTTDAEGQAIMERAARIGNHVFASLPNGEGSGVSMTVLNVQYPAEIINYKTIGDTPLLLSMSFAAGVIAAFAFTIVASVRRRRRDLALLKTLGFTRRQLGACIAWQASSSVFVALIIGIPLGILLGRWLWDDFARQIYAIPFATVPTTSLLVLAIGALVIANVVAFFPGRSAAGTAAALSLRSE